MLIGIAIIGFALVGLTYPNQLTMYLVRWGTSIITATAVVLAILTSGNRRVFWAAFAAFAVVLLLVSANTGLVPHPVCEWFWTTVLDRPLTWGGDWLDYEFDIMYEVASHIVAMMAATVAGFIAVLLWRRSLSGDGPANTARPQGKSPST